MGTRADFYIGRGEQAEWIGSIAWDGYPDDIELVEVMRASTDDEYRAQVAAMFGRREDATLPEQGWPWPWTDSHTTDYAYAFEDGKVWGVTVRLRLVRSVAADPRRSGRSCGRVSGHDRPAECLLRTALGGDLCGFWWRD